MDLRVSYGPKWSNATRRVSLRCSCTQTITFGAHSFVYGQWVSFRPGMEFTQTLLCCTQKVSFVCCLLVNELSSFIWTQMDQYKWTWLLSNIHPIRNLLNQCPGNARMPSASEHNALLLAPPGFVGLDRRNPIYKKNNLTGLYCKIWAFMLLVSKVVCLFLAAIPPIVRLVDKVHWFIGTWEGYWCDEQNIMLNNFLSFPSSNSSKSEVGWTRFIGTWKQNGMMY